jgi:glycosyltransferase involved in cell wall biosynthesis
MKALFVHSHIFFEKDNSIYSSGSLTYSIWTRYLKYFNRLHVVGRCVEINQEQVSNLQLSSGEHIDFTWTPELNKLSTLIQNTRQARRILREKIAQVDAVIIRLSEIGWIAAAEAERMGKPWVVEVVGDPWDALWNYGTFKGKIAAPVAKLRAQKWIAKAPYAIYVTNHTLQDKYPCDGVTAGVSDVAIQSVEDAILENRLKSMSEGCIPFKIGLIGSLKTKYKGIQTAIKALSLIREQIANCEFHVLGAGDCRPYRALAETLSLDKQVFFDGQRPSGSPVMQWLDDIDLYIQPSFTEGLPRALAEAMSRGCPALGSTAGGIPELLPAECLHRLGDAKQLAELLKKAIHDRGWRTEQAKRNFATAKDYHADVLNERRNQFWAQFAEYAKLSKR